MKPTFTQTFRYLASALLVAVLLGAVAGRGLAASPEQLRSVILLKALAYEKVITSASDTLVIGVVVPSSGAAAAEGKAMLTALGQAASKGVDGRPARVTKIAYQTSDQVATDVRSQRVDVLYVPGGLEDLANKIGSQVASEKRLLMCGDPVAVGRGCVLSVESQSRGSRLVVDVARATRAGFTFDARLLRLSRVVR